MNIQLHLLKTQLDYALTQGMYSHAEYLEESIRLIKGKEKMKAIKSTKVWNPNSRPTLKEAQEFVGGNVELVTLSNDRQLLVNEDGIFEDLPINEEATSQVKRYAPHAWMVGGIRGNVIILQGATLWN